MLAELWNVYSAIKTKTCNRCGGTGKELDHKEIGEEMRKIRKKADKLLKEVASDMKIGICYLCDLELGRRNWTPTLIAKFKDSVAGIIH